MREIWKTFWNGDHKRKHRTQDAYDRKADGMMVGEVHAVARGISKVGPIT